MSEIGMLRQRLASLGRFVLSLFVRHLTRRQAKISHPPILNLSVQHKVVGFGFRGLPFKEHRSTVAAQCDDSARGALFQPAPEPSSAPPASHTRCHGTQSVTPYSTSGS